MKFSMMCSYSVGVDRNGKNILLLGQRLEECGFDTFWIGDHLIDPLSLKIEYPYEGGFPDFSWPDGFAVCSAVAAATSTIKVATGITVVPYYPPVLLARAIATVDFISGGRFKLGAGAGWMPEEFATVGVPFEERGERTRDTLRIVLDMLQGRIPDFESLYFPMPQGTLDPMPIRKPHPPIICGGEGKAAARRIAAYGNGWLSRPEQVPEYKRRLQLVKEEMDAANRSMDELELTVITESEYILAHPHEIEEYAALGVQSLAINFLVGTFDRAAAGVEDLARRLMK